MLFLKNRRYKCHEPSPGTLRRPRFLLKDPCLPGPPPSLGQRVLAGLGYLSTHPRKARGAQEPQSGKGTDRGGTREAVPDRAVCPVSEADIYWEINTFRGPPASQETQWGADGSGSPHRDPRPFWKARLDLMRGRKELGPALVPFDFKGK